ncbi:phage holin family protein [Nonomuraea wenchangensis]|uniref:phage holin family protein n=1 Tax=Nonomuraea wenchangensis TaxID=568860 RepID=UPI0038513496
MRNHDNPRPAEEDVAGRLASDAAGLVRQEVARLRSEMSENVRRAGIGGGMIAAGALLGLLALHAGSVTLLRLLESTLSPKRAALALTSGYLTMGGALALLGLRRLRAASVTTRREVAHVKEEMAGAAEGARQASARTAPASR